ncbi:MAG: hypothetical protein K6F04_01940 [bacterium]|nr:hypothetical protein [bacterium]
MKISYPSKDGKIKTETFGGFSVYLEVNGDKSSDDLYSLDGDDLYRCDKKDCSYYKECSKDCISYSELNKHCVYMKKLKSLIAEYNANFSIISMSTLWGKLFGDTDGLSNEAIDNTVVHIEHDCKNCPKFENCKELVVNSGKCNCEFSSKLFELSAYGTGGIPVWNDEHTHCEAIMYGKCAKAYLSSKEKQR